MEAHTTLKESDTQSAEANNGISDIIGKGPSLHYSCTSDNETMIVSQRM